MLLMVWGVGGGGLASHMGGNVRGRRRFSGGDVQAELSMGNVLEPYDMHTILALDIHVPYMRISISILLY